MTKTKLRALMALPAHGVDRGDIFETSEQDARDLTHCVPARAERVAPAGKAGKGKPE